MGVKGDIGSDCILVLWPQHDSTDPIAADPEMDQQLTRTGNLMMVANGISDTLRPLAPARRRQDIRSDRLSLRHPTV